MAIVYLTSKLVKVASSSNPGGTAYGYDDGTGLGAFGDILETSGGSTDKAANNIYSGNTNVRRVYWQDSSFGSQFDGIFIVFSGDQPLNTWTQITIGSQSYSRSLFSRQYNSTNDYTTFSYTTATNPLGTTTNAEIPFRVEYNADNAITNTGISPTTITAGDSSSYTYTFSNGSASTRYAVQKESGTNPDGDANGTRLQSLNATGSGTNTFTLTTGELPSAGSTILYRIQASGPNMPITETEAGSWIDSNGSDSLTRESAASAPLISDVTNNNAASASVQVTVTLSDNGQGGTGLYYGRATTNNSDNVTTWQTSNTFQQNRGTDFYYFASRQNTVGSGNTLASSGVFESIGYLSPETETSNVLNMGAYLPASDTTFLHSVLGVSIPNTVYQVRTVNYNGTIVGSRQGAGEITVSDNPGFTPGATKTYYVTKYRTTSSGGEGSGAVTNVTTFTAYRSGDPAGTVTLAQKYIDVENNVNSGGSFYGFLEGLWGDISNTPDGATAQSVSSIFSSGGTSDINSAYWQDFSSDFTKFTISQSAAITNDSSKWTKVTIDDLDYRRSTASVVNSGSPQVSLYSWENNPSSQPFGTTTGANKLFEIKYEANTAANISGITNTSLSASQTVDSVATISTGVSTQRYRIVKTSGTTAGSLANGSVVGGRTGTGNLTIDNSEQPAPGNTCNYQLQVSAPYADFFDDYSTGLKWANATGTNNSFSITRAGNSAPIISDVTNNNAAAPSVTVTVSLSNVGSGGTGLYYGRASTNNSDNVTTWQTSNTFSQNRGDDFYYFASRQNTVGSGNTLASTGVLEEVDFLLPDRDINFTLSPGSSISAAYAGNVTVNVTNGSPDNRYRALRTTGGNLGCGNTGLIAGTTGSIIIGDAANELPVAGSSFSYTLQARLGTSSGGDDVTWYTVTSSPSTFTISRGASAAPIISDVTNDNDTSASVQVTVTLSNIGTGGDGLFYGRASADNSDNVTSWQTGNTFQQNRGTDFYYFASRSSDTGANNGLASTGVLESVGYIAPDSSISAQNVTFSGSTNETTSVTVLGTTAGDTIEVRVNSAPYTISYGSAVATGASTVVPVTSGLPTQGNTTTYRLSATRPTSTGGDGFFDLSSDTVSITREADSGPTFTVTSNCAAAATVGLTFNFSDVGSGGDGNLYYAIDDTLGITPPPFGWSTTQPSSQSRGTTRKYWVSRTSNGSSLNGSFTLASGYIPPDVDIGLTPTSKTLSSGVASTTFNILNTTQHHLYRVFDVDQGVDVSNSSGGGTLVVTIPLSGVQDGDVIDAAVSVALDTSRGGDGFPDDANTTSSIVVAIVDDVLVPSQFTFNDVGSASVGEIYDTFVQITGTGGSTLTASSVSGTATFAVSSTSTTPGSGFSQTSKNISENQYLHVRMQASSSPNTTVDSVLQVGDREDDWRITTGALPAVTYITEWYSSGSQSSFTVTSLSSDVVTGRGTNSAVNCQTMLPGDKLTIKVSGGPSSESSNLYALFSELGGRFDGEYTDVKIDKGQSYTATVADTFTGSVFLRLVSELNYTTNVIPVSRLINSTGYIPLHMKMPTPAQDYGIQVRGPNGTLNVIDENTNVASLETSYATTVSLNGGASTTIQNADVGNLGAVEYIIPGGINTESLSGQVLLSITSTSASTLEVTNTGSDAINNISFEFIRIF